MKRAVGRGLCAAAFLGLALLAAAPDAAAHSSGHTHNRLYPVHHLDNPRIITSPASGDTYLPGETITVYVPWGRTVSGRCINIHTVGTVELEMTVGGVTRTLTGRYENRRNRYGSGFDGTWLYFDYVVQKGDRDTDGVSLAEDALSSPGTSGSSIRGTVCGGFSTIELSKQLHGFGAQGGHKVDTPAPSWSGVLAPAVVFYEGASVNYRLPRVANAADAHNVSYSVTSDRPLPTGYTLNASTATITGSYASALARNNYTLRATDSFGRTADLIFTLEVSTGAGIESIAITSNPGADKTYGKVAPFGTNDTITVRVDLTHRLTLVQSSVCLNIQIGSNNRQVCNPSYSTSDSSRWDKLDFSYAVQAGDWDGVDGISFPNNPMGVGKTGGLRFRLLGGGGDNRVTRNFGPTPDDPNHKVRGQQTVPSFGSTASPSHSWVKGNAVSQALPAVPAATDGDGGVTYAIEGSLPAGLSFAAATRTISGTPTAAQGATDYTLAATDADGDRATLRFSIEIEEIAVSISSPSATEGAADGTATLEYDVTLNRAPGRQVTVDYAAAADPGTAEADADYATITGGTLTFAAAETSRTFEVGVKGDALDEPDETVRIALSNPSGAVLGSASTGVGTITDDDPTPTLALALSDPLAGTPDTIAESGAGNATTVTASLSGGISGEAITVTVAATGATAVAGDFSLSSADTLTIAAGATTSSGAVTVTAEDDATDEPDETATVGGTVAGGHGLVVAPSGLPLTIADDDARPRSALALSPASISESNGVATVTATLSNPSAAAVTVTVSAAPVAPAVAGDFALSSATTLTVAAGQTTSAGTVTVTAAGNADDAPDKSVTVSGSASGTLGAADPPDAALTIRDDDGTPTVSLVLSSSSVSENGGVATVTAALNGTSSEAVTVTVSAAAGTGAAAGDFSLSSAATLTIAASATASTGAVTITANNNGVDSPDKAVTVSGTATGGNGIAAPASLTLTLTDDEATPTTRLALSSASIAEAGGVSTVTATLSGVSSAATTITVSASPGAGTDFTLTGTTLTIAAGSTTSAGTVTVTAAPDTTDSADKRVTVSGAASGGNGAESPPAATLTIVDDDALPTLSLSLSASTIDESGSGNVATVTAALSHPSGEAVTVTVMLSPTLPAAANDFTLSTANTLTIAAGSTASAGDVTITAVDDPADAPDKETTVWGAATGGRGVTGTGGPGVMNPRLLTLTVADGDDAPGVTLSVSPASISENRNAATVTATLTHPSSAATTITVTPKNGVYTIGLVYRTVNGVLTSSFDSTIVIAAGETANASDTALVVAVNDDVHQGSAGRSTTVTGTAANTQGAGSVTGAPLTLTDNEALPEVTLALSPTSISETGGVSTVTATLSGASSEAVTVTVGAAAGTNAAAADFALSSATTLTIVAGNTTSSGAVTVTANGNAADSPDKQVTVSGTASGGNGVAAPSSVTLTLTDDEALPTVALVLSPSSISESGGVSSVTAKLSHPSSAAVTVTVDAAEGTGAIAADFALSGTTTLTIASGDTTSSGAVTVTANGNTVDSPDKSVTVSGTVSGGNGVAAPSDVTLTLTDDEDTPTVTLALSSSSISEGSGVTTVTAALSGASSEAVTVTVSAAPLSGAVVADYALSANKALVIAAGSTASTGAVTLTAVNNDVQAADKTVTVSGAASGGNGVAAPAGLTLTITDNDGSLPTGGGTRWTNGGLPGADWDVTTASLLGKTASQPIAISGTYVPHIIDVWACANKTVTRSRSLSNQPSSTDCTKLTDNSQPTTIALTQAMIDNDGVVIVFTIGGGSSTQYVNAEWVPIVALPKATLSLSPSSISENGGVSTVTATLDKAALSAATLTVSAPAGDLTLSAAATLTFATGGTASTGTVTVTAVSNTTDAPDKRVSVSAAASGDVRAPPAATLTITDDDAAPRVLLSLSSASIAENGGESMVSATLSHPSSAVTTVTVTAVSNFYTVGSDATIVIEAGETANPFGVNTVIITAVNDDVHQGSGGRSTTVTGTAVNSQGVGRVTLFGAPLTLTDDEALPTLALALSEPDPANPDVIPESWSGASTVTATLSGASSAAVTVTVAATGVTAAGGDFTLSSDKTLTIAAGATTSTGTVTVAPVDDTTDEADETVTVSATVSGGNGVAAPPSVTLTIRDDDAAPGVTLSLSPSSISENGGESTVTAKLTHPSIAATTVTVTAVSGGFYTVGSDATIVIAAGETANAADSVRIAAVNDAIDNVGNRSATVTGTAQNSQGVGTVMGASLTLTDDEATPMATLVLTPATIDEHDGTNPGSSTVTATLSGVSSEAVTLTVAATAGTNAAVGDFSLSNVRTLTIAAGATGSTGTVTVTAVDNATHSPDRSVTVSATVSGASGVAAPSSVTLTIEDDEALPTVTLALSSTSISESGAVSTVTATLSGVSSEAVTLTVAATGVTAAGAGVDFALSSTETLTIAAGATASTGTVTVTAVDDTTDEPDETVTVSGTVSGASGVAAPSSVTLTITDDETLPIVALVLSPSSISEDGGVSTVTATLSGASSEAVTVTVAAAEVSPAVAGDFSLSSAKTLTIASGSTASAGAVTITANDNDVDVADKSVTVSGTAAGGNNVADPSNATLTLTDDDTAGVTFSPTSITVTEEGAGAKFTVVLDSEPAPGLGTTWVGLTRPDTELDLNSALTYPYNLSFTPTSWNRPQTVTVTALGDSDLQDETKQIRYTAANYGRGNVTNQLAVTVTVIDDDKPVVSLSLSESSISENGGVATVTATLDKAATEATTVTVSAAAVSPAVPADFSLSSANTLTIAMGSTTSTGTVTVAAVDNATDAPDKSVTVSATVAGGDGAANPSDATLTIADNEAVPGVTLSLSASSISENGGESTVTATLSHPSSAATTVTVTAVADFYTVGSDATIEIAAGETANAADTATIAAVNNTTDAPDRAGTVTATVSNDVGAGTVSGGALTVTDDDAAPGVTLSLPYPSIPESNASTSVSATLTHRSSAATTVTVTPVTDFYTVGSDATIVIAAGSTAAASDTVRITAVDNDTDEPDRTVTLTATVDNDQGEGSVSGTTLTLTDNDAAPGVTLTVASSPIPENGGSTTVSATLTHRSSAATTVTVTPVSGSYTVSSSDATITIAAGETANATDTASITAVDNDVDAADSAVTVTGTAQNSQGAGTVSGASLTITDDDTAGFAVSPATSTTSRLRTTEDGGTDTFTVKLGSEPTGDVVLGVVSSDTTEGTVSASSLTFTDSNWNTAQTVTLTGVDDALTNLADGDKDYTVTLTVNMSSTVDPKYDALSSSPVTVYAVNADNEYGLNVSTVTGQATEGGGTATFTVALNTQPLAAVTVSVTSQDTSEGAASPSSLTFAATAWNTAQTVTVTGADDAIDDGDVTWAVRLDPSSGDADYNGLANVDVSVTTTDDEAPPTVMLALSPSSIGEILFRTSVSTVTATLSRASSEAVTVTVSATAVAPAVAGDFTQSGTTLTIAAGQTASTGTVTLFLVDNDVHAPDKQVTVSATVSGGNNVAAPSSVTLTLTDNERLPTVALVLSSPSITENSGLSTVTATLSGKSSEAVTVTVGAAAVAPAVAGDFTRSGTTLTIAAGDMTSTGTVTLTANDNAVPSAHKAVTVTGTAAGGNNVVNPAAVTLTILDDDAPVVALALSPSSISENGGVATVTATLDRMASVATTVTVAAAAVAPAVAGDFTRSGTTLTIAASATTSTGTVTLTAMDNATYALAKQVTVSGTVTGGDGAANPAAATLTITEDERVPTVTLALSSTSITEMGGMTTVSATLSHPSIGATTVTVTAVSGFYTVGTGADATIVIPAEATAAASDVATVTAEDDAVHQGSGGRATPVEFTAENSTGWSRSSQGPALMLTDNEMLPEVTLALSEPDPTKADTIPESGAGNASTVTATLSGASSEAVTVTVTATGATASAGDFTLSSDETLTIAAGSTTSAGTVTVTALDDTTDEADETVTVSGTAAGGNGVAAPSSVTLTLTDDETLPEVTLALSEPDPTKADTIPESGAGNASTVTATLSGKSSEAVTVTVSATGVTAVVGDFMLSSDKTLTIAAEATTSTGTVTVTAVDDTTDEADETVTVSATVSGGNGVAAPSSVTLTITDDETLPEVTLVLSPTSIGEDGGVSTVTATLSGKSSEAVTVTVGAAAGTGAMAADFDLSTATTLTIAAEETTSTGAVTVTANDNDVDSPDKSVTVSGTATGGNNVAAPSSVTLTITDDDPAPMLSIDSPSVTEGDSGSTDLTFTATLSAASGREVTVQYADAGTGTATSGTDYTALTAGTLTFPAGTTSQTFDVAVTGDVLDEANETVKVRLKDPVNAAVSTTAGTGTGTITDNDATPTLSISSPSVMEGDSGSAALTYTVTLSAASGRRVTVQYADAGLGTATSGTDYTAITAGALTFAAGTTSRTFSVLVTGDTVNESNETVEVTFSGATNATISTPGGVTVNWLRVTGTITDDDGAPDTITLTVDDDDVGEGDGATTITVTATVDGTTRFAEAKTVSVSVSQSGTSGNVVDFAAVSSFNIEIAAGAASGTGTFTLTPTDDTEDELDETITVSGTSTGLTVNPATISLTDNDGTPTSITLTVNDNSVGEGDGATTITVTATLDGSTTLGSATTVQVNVAGSGAATAVDFDTVSAFDITIAAGDASGTANFTLTPTNDVVDETDETITVRGTSSGLTVNSATISLTDDDAAPTAITLTVSDSSVGEGDGATSITVTATVDGTTRFAEAKTVRVSVAGSGTAGAVDFAAVEAFDIEIAAGAASDTAGFTLTPTDDAVDETNETITVSGASGSLTVNAATISLTDDDAAPTSITLTVDDTSVGEGDGAATITVTATVDGTMRFAEDTTVTVSVAGSGTATAVDFAAVSSFNITIPAGAASKTGSFTLTPTNDAVDETDETVTVSGSSGSLTVNSATITLTDDDAAPTAITLTVSDTSVSEGDGATAITVTATVDGTTRFAEATTVEVLVRGTSGTSTAVDFTAVSLFEIVIAAGAASGASDFTLTPTNDVLDETDETVTVYGASPGLTVSSATITLTDDDATPTSITLSVDDNSVAEDDGATTITVTATVDGGTRFIALTTVTVSVAGSGTASAVDFAAVSDFDIEIEAGDASATGTFTLTPTNDAFDETNETITVSGTSGSLTVSSATITLTDDDDAPTAITLTVDDNSVAEDDGATTITVTATVDGASRFVDPTTVTVSVGGSGTATAVDFAAVSDFDIEIEAGDTSATGTFTLTPTNDAVDETNETVTVSGSSGSLTVNSATITLTDDDATPSITLTVNDNSVAEDDGATTITVTATVDGTTRFAGATTVTVSVGGSGTDTAVDFAAVSDFDITIAAEAQSKTGTFTLTPTDDAVDETTETVTVSGSSGSLTVNSATITLTDDEALPTVTLALSSTSISETGGVTTVTATLSGASSAAVTVTVGAAGATASAGDFSLSTATTLTIASGSTTSAGTVTVTAVGDARDETDETVTVSGTAAGGNSVANPSSLTLTLTDDDTAGFAVSPSTTTTSRLRTTENGGLATFTVALESEPTGDVVLGVVISDTTEGAASTSSLTFTAMTWSTAQTVTLAGVDDAAADTDQDYTVTLTVNTTSTVDANYDALASSPVTVYAVNADNEYGLNVSEVTGQATESGGQATFTVALLTRPTAAVTVSVSSRDTSEGAASPSSLTFAATAWNTAQTVTVTGADDAIDDGTVTWAVRLDPSSGDANYNRLSNVDVSVTTTDDDAAPTAITLTVDDNSVGEGDGATTITVTATVDGSTRFAAATTVSVSVAGSGTMSAVDFSAVSDFDIEIAAGAESEDETFTLTPTNDTADETDETITVSGTSGSLTVNSATISLTDDDAAPTLSINSPSVSEGDSGSTSLTYTVTLSAASARRATVQYADAGTGTATSGTDYTAITGGTLTFAAGTTSQTFNVSVTGDVVAESNETVVVTWSNAANATISTRTGIEVSALRVDGTITDDDAAPTSITLTVNDNSVGEGDGATTITVTATVDGTTRFAEATTVSVNVAGSGTATAVDFAVVSDFDISIAAGAASKTGTFTLTPTNDAVDETNETVTVSGTSGSLTVNQATITLTDDDAAPGVTLSVASSPIPENGGSTTVSATLTHPSVAATTVTVTAVTDFYTVGADETIVIAAGETASTDTATIAAVNDDVDNVSNRSVTVTGTAANSQAAANSETMTVTGASLTLTDDDTAGLAVSPATTASSRLRTTESGGTDTFTVKLSSEPTGDVVLGVVSSHTTEGTVSTSSLTFTNSNWNTAQTVTLTGVDDSPTLSNPNPSAGNRPYTVTLTVNATSTADDNYDALASSPVMVYAVNADNEYGLDVGTVTGQATEAGGTATFTVALVTQPSAAVTVSVTSRDASEGAASPSSLTFATTAWNTAQTVTVTGADDAIDDGDVTWAVRLDPSSGDANYDGLSNVDVSVTTTDDDGAPGVVLVLSPSSISESGGAATVTATLSHPSGAATTVTVTAVSGFYMVGSDATITIAAGSTANASDTVTITAVNDDVHQGAAGRSTTVMATVANSMGAGSVSGGALTLSDDEAAPGAELALSDASISENGGTSVVSATLSGKSAAATTVTVTPVSGAYTVGSDATIVIAAGSTANASDTVTITAVNDDVHQGAAGRSTTVMATVANSMGAGTVSGATLTLTDDDAAPGVTLVVASSSIPENGGSTTVSATLTHRSSAVTTVTVTAVSGSYTVASGAGATIVIAAGSTASTDTATIAAVNDDVDNVSNRSVTVTGTAANAQAAANSETMTVTGASLTLTDDDTAGLVLSPSTSASSRLRTTESGGTAAFEVKLSSAPTGDVVLGVASSDTTEGTVSASSLTFTATTWSTAQTVTVTGVDDAPANPADGNRDYTVTLTVNPSTADVNYNALSPVTVYAVNADNEYGLELGTVTGPVTEAGGQATFTVALVTQPSAAVTVSVTSRDTSEGTVSPSSLTFETSDWSTARTVTVTGVDDDVDDGDVAWAVRLDPSSGGDASYDGLDDEDVSVTTTDDDATPTARLVLTPSTIDEGGTANTVATVTARLNWASSAATTVTVAPVPESPAVADDYTLTGTTLTIAAGSMASVGTVTIAAKNNDVDAADKTVTVTGTAQNTRAAVDSMAVAVEPAMLTITDDDEKGLELTPAEFVEVTEGGAPAAYTVALTSEPVGEVAVAVAVAAEGNAFLSISPPSLTFTATDWRQAKTVTLTARDDGNDVAESSSVSHTASGGGYGGVSGSLPVSVAGETTVRTSAASGTTTYVIEGRRVKVTVMAGVPEGIVVDFAGVGSVAAETVPTMTIAPSRAVPATVVARAADDGFNLGPEGSRTVVDLEVTDAPGVRVCLPVNAAVVTGAGDDGRLRLIRHDGSVWAVAGKDYDAAMSRICASGVTAFSPFATGYADTQPEFDSIQPALVFTVDEAIEPVTLPLVKEGTGDPPVKYALTPGPESLPQGLDFDYETQMLSGTPTEESAREDYVWTATDRDDEVASLPFTIEVKPALAKARARLKSINESILPELSRAMWGSVLDAVTGRLEGSGPGGGMAGTVAEALRAHERSQDEEGLTWRKVLEGRTFAVGLGGGSGDSGSGSAVVWGGGSLRSLSLDKEALDWSGDLFSAHMGVDAPLGESLRGGLAATWFEGEIEYTDRSGEAAVTGVHESRMTAVHPYLGWSGPDGSRLWGMLGYGEGEIEIADAEVMERFGVQKGDSEFVGAALGGSVPVLTSLGGLRVALKGSGEATRYSVDDNGEAIAAVSVDTHRLRLSAEGSRAYVLSGGGTLTPSLEVGGRWDGGDGETGAGVELGVGVEWALPSRGLVVEARGRTLAAHAGAVEDWGVSGSARLLPGPGGRGPSFELSPGWGASESGFGRLWSEGVAGRASSDEGGEEGAARLGAELGYGFGVWGGAGVVTPHAGFGYEEGGDRRYRLGVRLELGPSLEAGLQAGREEGAADPEHDVKLNLRLMW